jgi:hypothetical protein
MASAIKMHMWTYLAVQFGLGVLLEHGSDQRRR